MAMSDFGEDFCLTLLTDDAALAAAADACGVQRIGIDIERLHKAARQPEPGHRISRHDWPDLARLAPLVRRAELFVRLNPLHDGTAGEVETALGLGARVLMLPFFTAPAEAARFIDGVAGRARTVLLVETAPALAAVHELVRLEGVQELMFGLNDLRLQLGMASHFQVLASPQLARAAACVREAGLPLAVGGVARAGDARLPVPADLVHAQYPRLGATGAWLARSFFGGEPAGTPREAELAADLIALRRSLTRWARRPAADLEEARQALLARAERAARPRAA